MRMYHPEHGFTNTDPFISEESLKKHGWVNCAVDAIIEHEEDAQEEFAVEQLIAKRGRPAKQRE
jgi:hypothetical protein